MHVLQSHAIGRAMWTFRIAVFAGLYSIKYACRVLQHSICMQGFTASGSDVPVLLLIDTAGCGCDEQTEEDSDSKRNDGEAQVCSTSALQCQQCQTLCFYAQSCRQLACLQFVQHRNALSMLGTGRVVKTLLYMQEHSLGTCFG